MTLYSIGTSNRTWPGFLAPLIARGVTRAVDVRSKPRSRFAQFNRARLGVALEHAGIAYHWRGDVLGGEPAYDPADPQTHVALSEILDAARISPVAYFCSEGDPANCHRTFFVGAQLLRDYGARTANILRNDEIEDIEKTLARMSPPA